MNSSQQIIQGLSTMKAKELKEILSKVDDDEDIFIMFKDEDYYNIFLQIETLLQDQHILTYKNDKDEIRTASITWHWVNQDNLKCRTDFKCPVLLLKYLP